MLPGGGLESRLRTFLRRLLLLGIRSLTLGGFLLPLLVARSDVHVAAAPGYSFGVENSWIRVQNIGQANANVEIDYFNSDGLIAGKDLCPSPTCPPMFPGSGWTFFQKGNPN